MTKSDLQTGHFFAKDYMVRAKSRPVLDYVIGRVNPEMTLKELEDSITLTVPKDTRILSIAVVIRDPSMGQAIAEAVRESSSAQFKDIMNAESCNVIEKANFPSEPSSPHILKNIARGGSCDSSWRLGSSSSLYILDDTVKTPDDVSKYLELSILTVSRS